MVLFNRCLKNDKDFESSNECIQSVSRLLEQSIIIYAYISIDTLS